MGRYKFTGPAIQRACEELISLNGLLSVRMFFPGGNENNLIRKRRMESHSTSLHFLFLRGF